MTARSGIRPSSLFLTVIAFTLITLGVMPLECPPQNTPPTAPEVVIEPDPAFGQDALTCIVAMPSYDADGDTVTYGYEWFLDENPTGLAGETVPPEETAVGDDWECAITPHDGTEAGPAGRDSIVIEPYAVSGVYDLSPAIDYSCANGEVDLDFPQFTFTDNGTTFIVEPAISEWCSLIGPSASGGEIFAYCANRGICDEFFTLTGSFVDNDTWVASLGIYFFGTHEMCLDCINHAWTITGTRVEE